MTVTSPQGIAGEQLRRMLSLSNTFQGETGGTAALSAQHVYFGSVPDLQNQTTCPRPLAVIGFEDGIFTVIAGGDQTHLRQRGMLRYWIVRNSDSDDVSQAELNAMDFFSNTLTDIAALAGAEEQGRLPRPGEAGKGGVPLHRAGVPVRGHARGAACLRPRRGRDVR